MGQGDGEEISDIVGSNPADGKPPEVGALAEVPSQQSDSSSVPDPSVPGGEAAVEDAEARVGVEAAQRSVDVAVEDVVEEEEVEPVVDGMGVEELIEVRVDAVAEKPQPVDVAEEKEVEPVDAKMEKVEPLVDSLAEKELELLVDAAESRALVSDSSEEVKEATDSRASVGDLSEEAGEPLADVVAKDQTESSANAVSEEKEEPLLDYVMKDLADSWVSAEAVDPLVDAAEKDQEEYSLDAVMEEDRVKPLIGANSRELDPLAGALAGEDTERLVGSTPEEDMEHLIDAVMDEGTEPLVGGTAEVEVAPIVDEMIDERKEPLGDNMMARRMEPLGDGTVEGMEHLADATVEEMEPLTDATLEGSIRPLGDASEGTQHLEEDASTEEEHSVDNATTEEMEHLVDATVEERMEALEDATAEGREHLGDGSVERMEPLGDASVERMEPLGDVSAEGMEDLGDGPMVEKMEAFVDGTTEGEEHLGGASAVGMEPLTDASTEGMEHLGNATMEERMEEASGDATAEGKEHSVDTSAEQMESLGDAMVQEKIETSVDDVLEEMGPLRAATTGGMRHLEDATTEEMDHSGFAKVEERMEVLGNAIEEGVDPLEDAGSEGVEHLEDSTLEKTVYLGDTTVVERMETLGDARVKGMEPLRDDAKDEMEQPRDAISEEGTETLGNAVAEDVVEPLFRVSEEEKPVVDGAVMEKVEPFIDASVEPDKELVDVVMEKKVEPLAGVVKEKVDPLLDAEPDEKMEPLSDVMVEEKEHLVEALGEEAIVPSTNAIMEEDSEPPVVTTRRGGGKRKRGRPPKAQPSRASTRRKVEEDVCFICFDGGNLVVCDRRGCPKVYHPQCVNRDEAFFRSKGRWNCGWHICSSCEKSANYMCYTCTYSLCKGCVKESGFLCVRGNKGLCQTCLSTVMLIETNQQANKAMSQVDFDDKNSWEYLFKDYWLDLKGKLSLTLEELTRARTPRKESNLSVEHEESSDELYDANNDQVASSDSSPAHREISNSTKKRLKKRTRSNSKEEDQIGEAVMEEASHPDDTDWASKELLEFVAHMKNGDRTLLSQFDVQALLLEYIKRNNLRDPRRKSQIICDARLQSLFGKPRVGHFEMLKLLESHFLVKEGTQPVTDDSQGGVVDPDSSPMDAEGNSDASTRITLDKRRKNRKRLDERELQNNLDDYAAIDVHNINLMYLRRNLMEDLLDDADGFEERVIGSFVRIRISAAGQKQDMYRLVQVVGTRRAAEKYKTGKKMTDIILEILNLNKTEIISIDIISNQEFTEEECKRLRQSIKCGLISRLTVGDIQEKARALQAVRVNDWLENEKSRLGHLRDRASEKGRRKELRECVEKLQLLNTPEERVRRLNEVPEIHADPHMDPDYESAEEGEPDDKKLDSFTRPRESSSLRKPRETSSLRKGSSSASSIWNAEHRNSSNSLGQVEGSFDRIECQRKEAVPLNVQSAPIPSENLSASVSAGVAPAPVINETDKIWHYQDPSGKIQGPFSMTQLRKWSTTGYFPQNLRIWKGTEKQEDAILLTDALNGKFMKDLPPHEPQHSSFPQSNKAALVADNRGNNLDGGWKGHSNPIWTDNKENSGNWKTSASSASPAATASYERAKTDKLVCQPPAWSGQVQAHNTSRSTGSFAGNPHQSPTYQERGSRGASASRWSGGHDQVNNLDSSNLRGLTSSQGYEKSHLDLSSSTQQFAGEQNAQAAYGSSGTWGNDPYPPTPTPLTASMAWIGSQAALSNSTAAVQSLSSGLGASSRGIGTHLSSLETQDSSTPASSVMGWGVNTLANVSTSIPTSGQMVGTSASAPTSFVNFQASLPQISHLGATNILGNQSSEPLAGDRMSPVKNPLVYGLSSSRESSAKNSFFESGCPSPTPKCEQATVNALPSEYRGQSTQMNGRQVIPSDHGRSDLASLGRLDPNSQPVLSEVQDNPPLLADLEKAGTNPVVPSEESHRHHAPPDAKAAAGSDAVESASVQRMSLSGPVPVGSTHFQVLSDTKMNEWSMPSPTPATIPSPWGAATTPTSKNNQNSQFVSSNGSDLVATSQRSMHTSNEPSQPVIAPKDVQNQGWVTSQQNPNSGTGTGQGSGNIGSGTLMQGNVNSGWGMVPQGNMNMAWGIPAQGNANMNMNWATPAQMNTTSNAAWATSAQGNANVNLAWGAMGQGVATLVPTQGYPNTQPGWGSSAPGNTNQNPSWGVTSQTNTNANTGQGNMTMTWDPSSGNASNWNGQQIQQVQQAQGGDGHSGQRSRGFHGSESGHGSGRQSWSRSHSGGGGGGSRPSDGQRAGVCRFHESGYCKKGANCNYYHS